MTTKTLVIWTDFESLPKFVLLDGDYSHWDGMLANSMSIPEEVQDEICSLMFEVDGSLGEHYTSFPAGEYNQALATGTVVVATCGFIP